MSWGGGLGKLQVSIKVLGSYRPRQHQANLVKLGRLCKPVRTAGGLCPARMVSFCPSLLNLLTRGRTAGRVPKPVTDWRHLSGRVGGGSGVRPECAPPSCWPPGYGVRSRAGWGGDGGASRHVGPCAAGHGTRAPGTAAAAPGGDQLSGEVRGPPRGEPTQGEVAGCGRDWPTQRPPGRAHYVTLPGLPDLVPRKTGRRRQAAGRCTVELCFL